MINTTQSYRLNNTTVNVDLNRVQTISPESERILREFNNALPQSFKTIAHLKTQEHYQSIEKTAKLLKNAQDNATKDKIVALLKTAFLVSLLTFTILSCVFIPPSIAPVLAGLFYFIFSFLFSVSATDELYRGDRYGNRHTQDLRGVFLNFLLPGSVTLYEAFTRVSRYTKALDEKKAPIIAMLNNYKRDNTALLPGAYQFYRDQTPALTTQLDLRTRQIQAGLTQMQNLPVRSLRGEEELSQQIAALTKAREELNTVAAFYRQFDPR